MAKLSESLLQCARVGFPYANVCVCVCVCGLERAASLRRLSLQQLPIGLQGLVFVDNLRGDRAVADLHERFKKLESRLLGNDEEAAAE
eukprot:3593003-Amphidinium_carterae.1